MGGDTLVPGMTEEDLRLAAVMAVQRLREVQPLAPHEFVIRDWMDAHNLTRNAAERELDDLVEAKVLGMARRYDKRSGRQVNGYWRLE